MTKLTIITVCFNSYKTIESTITSIIMQDYNNIEYIIIDGGSSDGTLELIDKHKENINILISEPDSGIYDAMNKGLRYSTGDVITFLNSDDVYASDSIVSEMIKELDTLGIDLVYSDLVYVSRENCDHVVRFWKSCEYERGLFLKGWMPAHPTTFIKKHVYEKFGFFDIQYKFQADFELMLRFIEINNIKTKYIPKLSVIMKDGGASNNSIINTLRGNYEAYHACRRKHKLNVNFLFIPRKILSRVPQFFKKIQSK